MKIGLSCNSQQHAPPTPAFDLPSFLGLCQGLGSQHLEETIILELINGQTENQLKKFTQLAGSLFQTFSILQFMLLHVCPPFLGNIPCLPHFKYFLHDKNFLSAPPPLSHRSILLTNQCTCAWTHYTGTIQGTRTDHMAGCFQRISIE